MNTAASNVRPFPTAIVLPRLGARRDGTHTPPRPVPAAPSRETDEVVSAPGTPAILFGAIAGGYVTAFAAGWLAFVQAVPIV